MHAWMKRRLRRVLERRHTLYPPVSRLLLSDYRLLNVYGVMWPRRPGFFSGKRYSIILPSNSESNRRFAAFRTYGLLRVVQARCPDFWRTIGDIRLPSVLLAGAASHLRGKDLP
ncbi:hypothetical protein BDZ89DRAFT_342114 [Hymenopellis radicata]|nr:hypothetical protein BDZ89DRAFT_342114 [Hymenopellis radicata]